MSFAAQSYVPGAFNFDTSAPPGQTLHANVFRPPRSPSASSYNLAKSTGSLYSDISMSATQAMVTAKRKRTSTRESTPMEWNLNMDSTNDGREGEQSREHRYTLAGQISTTPAGAAVGAQNGLLEDSVYSDVDYRRALGPKAIPETNSPSVPSPFETKSNSPTLAGWSLFSLQTIGDMVGKVWEFCKNGAFRGFHAGGGKGYDVNGSTVTETTGKPWESEHEGQTHPTEDPSANEEVPMMDSAQQAQSPYSPLYYNISSPEVSPQPAAKRRQVSANNDELRNWVMVDEPSEQKPRRFAAEVKAAAARSSGLTRPRLGYYSQPAVSTHRRISTPSSRFTGGAPNLSRAPPPPRPSLRISHAGSPHLTPREPASFASPRSPPTSRSTPSRIPVPIQSPGQYSHNPNPFAFPSTTTTTATAATTFPIKTAASRPSSRHSPRRSLVSAAGANRPMSPSKTGIHHHRRNQSGASAASTTLSRRHGGGLIDADGIEASPRLDAEARQLAQRKLAAERDADAKVDEFNARLLSMIRQGREALGTKVEVEMVGDGFAEGWEDDDN
ncbi:hypothetical protein VTK56DRAFT_4427 [Thermocarpiscus australiensis]